MGVFGEGVGWVVVVYSTHEENELIFFFRKFICS